MVFPSTSQVHQSETMLGKLNPTLQGIRIIYIYTYLRSTISIGLPARVKLNYYWLVQDDVASQDEVALAFRDIQGRPPVNPTSLHQTTNHRVDGSYDA